MIPPSLAQDQSNQQQQQLQWKLKALHRAEEHAEKFQKRVQPLADRFAEAILPRRYSDPIVQGSLRFFGQSPVPVETRTSTTFSVRVVEKTHPNACASPDGRIYRTTATLADVENEAQITGLAMVL